MNPGDREYTAINIAFVLIHVLAVFAIMAFKI